MRSTILYYKWLGPLTKLYPVPHGRMDLCEHLTLRHPQKQRICANRKPTRRVTIRACAKEMNDFRPLDIALLCFPGYRYLPLVRNKCAVPVLKVGGGLWSLNQISQALSLIFDVILIQVSVR